MIKNIIVNITATNSATTTDAKIPFTLNIIGSNKTAPTWNTNVLKKDPNYRTIMHLFEFLRGYQDIGYTIKVVEQNPAINEHFEKDIFHNILFNYLVLKGHLERDKDRQLPAPLKEKKHSSLRKL